MYHQNKGLGEPKVYKSQREKFLLPDQVAKIMATIDASDVPEELRIRDRAMVYLGFHLGLRVGEVGLLMRKSFRTLSGGTAMIPTLKKSPRIAARCDDCGRKFRVAVIRIGDEYPCPRCGKQVMISGTKKQEQMSSIPEVEIPIPEESVRSFIRGYLDKIPSGQECLFVSRPHNPDADHSPLVDGSVGRIFGSWIIEAGLSPKYSFHALRHGRGVQLYEATKDLKFVQTCLRHDSMATSEIYIHLSPENVAKFANELERRALSADDRLAAN